MKYLSYSIILIFGFLSVSCEKEIPFPEQESEAKLVVNATFSVDSTWSVHVSKSIPVSQSGTPENITNASVQVLDASGTLIRTLPHTENGFYQVADLKPEAGQSYQIEVSAPGFETASASGFLPKDFSFNVIDTSSGTFLEFPVLYIDLEIDDEANQENYYLIQASWEIETEDSTSLSYSFLFLPVHFVFDQNTENNEISSDNSGYDRIYLPDATFDGEQYQTRLAVEYPAFFEEEQGVIPSKLIITVSSVDSDLYKYTKTLDRYYNNNDELFSEPVQIHNNIKNGLGVFGGFIDKSIEVEF